MGVPRLFDVLFYVLPATYLPEGRFVVYLGIQLITPALDARSISQVHLVVSIILDLTEIHGLQGLLMSIAELPLRYAELEPWLK